MKKLFALLLAFLLLISFAACGEKENETETTRSQAEILADANENAAKLAAMKTRVDADMAVVNSTENVPDGEPLFIDFKAMGTAVAAYEAALDELTDTAAVTDKDAADALCVIYHAVETDAMTCARTYYDFFTENFGVTEINKLHCLAFFMSEGKTTCVCAITYTDDTGAEKTVYSQHGVQAGVSREALATLTATLFSDAPFAALDPVANANLEIDLEALYAAAAEEASGADTTAADTTAADTTAADTTAADTTAADTTAADTTAADTTAQPTIADTAVVATSVAAE